MFWKLFENIFKIQIFLLYLYSQINKNYALWKTKN
jgi:hypothetical protein